MDEKEEIKIEETTETKKMTKKEQFIEILKYACFAASAGVIQFVTTGVLSNWTGWLEEWIGYLIGLVLSVIWNFTFNRKFTFKSASNIPLAMTLTVLYYCAFTPLSTFGVDALVNIGWNSTLLTALMMLLNFITEFLYQKFLVFNDKATNKLLNLFKKKSKKDVSEK